MKPRKKQNDNDLKSIEKTGLAYQHCWHETAKRHPEQKHGEFLPTEQEAGIREVHLPIPIYCCCWCGAEK